MSKTFVIHTLSGKNIQFDFDIGTSLALFRKNITARAKYSLIHKGKVIIYENDNENSTVRSILEMVDIEEIISEPITHLYLTENWGYPRIRVGKLLLGEKKLKEISHRKDLPDILVCPINLELIHYPVKINERFYDVEALSNYLSEEINKWTTHASSKKEITCPFRIPIDMNIICDILKFDIKEDGTCNKIHPNTVQNCFIYNIFVYRTNKDQSEYDQILLDYEKSVSHEM